MTSRHKAWFFVLLFFIIKVEAEKTSTWLVSSHARQQSKNEYVMLTLCQDSSCEETIDLEWESLFQWQVCTFMPQMESYFWFEKTPYGPFYKICSDWMCLNCSLCGAFQSSYDTCIPMPFFNAYGRLEQVVWSTDPPTATSTSNPSTSAQPDPTTTASTTRDPSPLHSSSSSPTATPSTTIASTNIPLNSHSDGNQKIGDHNATDTSSKATPTPQHFPTPSITSSPQQTQPVSTKIHQTSGGLSGGSIAGIVIGSVAGGLFATGLTAFIVRRRRAIRNMRALQANSHQNLSVERS
ncbi:hypothetical protein GpartN1_g3904.t1 [Galdieria partita]|uniref:Transmembrane protein n=1 Tax=Galdieria partita TaxID=83374 RepID=A0A9C7UQQ6_9RHOD|nr:hypothetical protein GpartN1_g3904.t1 [Galdieria partita]